MNQFYELSQSRLEQLTQLELRNYMIDFFKNLYNTPNEVASGTEFVMFEGEKYNLVLIFYNFRYSKEFQKLVQPHLNKKGKTDIMFIYAHFAPHYDKTFSDIFPLNRRAYLYLMSNDYFINGQKCIKELNSED